MTTKGQGLDSGKLYTPDSGNASVAGGNTHCEELGQEHGSVRHKPLGSFVTTTQESQNGTQEKTKNAAKGIMHLLSVYADKCSLNGVIFIKSSKYLVVKALWAFLLLISVIVMNVHLSKLAETYYSYGKQTKVDLKFESLKFPAVTFCNVNAMRKSQNHLASGKLQQLIEKVSPDEMYADSEKWESHAKTVDVQDDGDLWGALLGLGRRRKRSTNCTTSNSTEEHGTDNIFDELDSTWMEVDSLWNDLYNKDTYIGSWESESQPSAFDEINGQFTNLYNQENGTTRQQMGHRIQDMLIQCSFVGRKCVQSNFTMVASSTMGNCFTIQYDKFIARRSGPREGLILMLNLETDEYVPGITNAKGAKIVVHEPGTIPFPDDEGMAISAGMETSIGLRRTSITRLDKPHGECTKVDAFKKRYGIKYTRQACQEICEMEEILSACHCYNSVRPFIYTLLRNRKDVKPCQLELETLFCMDAIAMNFQADYTCHCSSPCKEVTYKKTVSSKPWPSYDFSKLIAKSVCIEKPNNNLCNYSTMSEDVLRNNFLKVNVYFETLNYESVTEEPDYTEFQFMSDIGGTIGLYIGISVLSAFELLHLFIAVVRYLIVKHTKNERVLKVLKKENVERGGT